MNRRFPLLVVLCSLGLAVSSPAETLQEVYARGMRAFQSGDLGAAKAAFAQVLAADPQSRPAQAMMKRVEMASAASASSGRQLERLIVPKIDFRDTSLTTVLDYLPRLAKDQSKGQVAVNIVQMFPMEYGREKTINLQLSNVPMSSVIDYVAQLGGLTVEYQPHAVVMKLAQAPAPPAPAQ